MPGLTDRPDGAEVTFNLSPHLLVKDVRVKGNIVILERDLARMLRLRPAEPFREETVRGDIERFLRFYEEQGHQGATVVEELARESDQVRVTYRINEGRPRVVQKVLLHATATLPGARSSGARDEPVHVFRGSDLQRGLDNLRD